IMGLLKKFFSKTKEENKTNYHVSFQEEFYTPPSAFSNISNKEELFNAVHPFSYTEFINYNPNYKLTEEQKIVAFLSWCNKTKQPIKSNDKYPYRLSYLLRIDDLSGFHNSLIENGYLKKADVEYSLSKLTIKELKEILDKYNISVKGKKSDYVNAILNSVDVNTLQLTNYYELTEKGKNLLSTKDNKEFIVAFENRYGVSLAEFYNVKKYLNKHLTPNDILWQILLAKYDYEKLDNCYFLARNALLNQAYLLQDEEKYIAALEHYIYVAYFDLSGCCNNCIEEKERALIAPAIVEFIQKYKDYYVDKIMDRCTRLGLPHHYYSIEEFDAIIKSIMDNNEYYKQFIS
ncbi:MAG: SAP domain-containing protein, partial [Eubacterium sp.]|nr:SAP domain-containing protein [Eubacterium sp.]